MEFMNSDLTSYINELFEDNLYKHLSSDEQEKIETELKNMVEEFSENIEKKFGSSKGVELKLFDEVKLYISSELQEESLYRGAIKCSRLLIIGTYELFYRMDYSNIVSDGKNIGNIKRLLFNTSMRCMFYHELAHIYKGHLNLYSIWKKEQSIKDHYLDIQTLEWDADCYAATQIVNWIYSVQKEVLPLDKTNFILKIACGAIHGMMYWQRQNTDFRDIANKEHPPILHREMVLLQVIMEKCNYAQNIMEYVALYEKEFNRIRNISSDKVEKYLDDLVKTIDYMKLVAGNWENVEPKLQQYSIFPL